MATKLDVGTKKVMEFVRLHEALENSRGLTYPPEAVKAREQERERYSALWNEIANALNASKSEAA